MAICDSFITYTDGDYETIHDSYRISAPEGFNFGFDVVDRIAAQTPDRLALMYVSARGEEKRITFGEMMKRSNQAANYFKLLGIKRGDKVMLILKRNYQYWYCNVALCKLGAVMIPATSQLAVKDIVYRNNAAGVKMIVCSNDMGVIASVLGSRSDSPTLEHIALVNGKRKGFLSFDEGMSRMPDTFLRPSGKKAIDPRDPMLIYFTSGTTGYPKMAMQDFLYPLGHIATAKLWHGTQDGGLHFTISDTGWAKSAWGKIYGQWLTGSAVMVYDFERFNAREILDILQKYDICTFCAPPTMYRMLAQEDISRYDLSSIKHCCSAGEPLNLEISNEWYRCTGLRIYEGFGQTETTCCLGTLPGMPLKPGSMGRPMPGYDIMLLNSDGSPCQAGETGEICVRLERGKPLGLFNGYYKEQSLTYKVWHDGFYHTGDTAYQDGDGYFWYVGRADDIIKSSGYRIGPFEVESALIEHPAVMEAAVTGAPDAIRGQVVKATIVLREGFAPSEELKKELQAHVKASTAPYKYPRIIEFVESLPKTVTGKVKRSDLRAASAAPQSALPAKQAAR